MKLLKRDIGKLFLVRWEDANSEYATTLEDFLKKGFAVKESVGWLKHFDKDKIIFASERCENTFDLTMLSPDWVIEMTEQKEVK